MLYRQKISKNDLDVVIVIEMFTNYISGDKFFIVKDIEYKEKKKRKFNSLNEDLISECGFRFSDNRKDYFNKKVLTFVTIEDIYNAKLVAWESIKPKLGTFYDS
jgi:hypothetical protein